MCIALRKYIFILVRWWFFYSMWKIVICNNYRRIILMVNEFDSNGLVLATYRCAQAVSTPIDCRMTSFTETGINFIFNFGLLIPWYSIHGLSTRVGQIIVFLWSQLNCEVLNKINCAAARFRFSAALYNI